MRQITGPDKVTRQATKLAYAEHLAAFAIVLISLSALTDGAMADSVSPIDGSASMVTPCGIDLVVSGGVFAPDECRFEIISGGPSCADSAACKPEYVLSLKNSKPSKNDIINVRLRSIPGLKTGTYRFDPTLDSREFRGQLLDKGAVVRNLVRGAIVLDVRADAKVDVAFELEFANNISLRGSGLVDVQRVSAP